MCKQKGAMTLCFVKHAYILAVECDLCSLARCSLSVAWCAWKASMMIYDTFVLAMPVNCIDVACSLVPTSFSIRVTIARIDVLYFRDALTSPR